MAFFFSRLLSGLSLMSLFPLLYALAAGEAVASFFFMLAVSAGISFGLRRLGAKTADGLSLREGIAITSIGWLLCSATLRIKSFVYPVYKTECPLLVNIYV